jgi:hypothetical protein
MECFITYFLLLVFLFVFKNYIYSPIQFLAFKKKRNKSLGSEIRRRENKKLRRPGTKIIRR